MNRTTLSNRIHTLVISALLCAIGIMIPMFFPKVVLGPASFTLASHVPVFLAVFISPVTAAAVSVCTGVGFLFSTSPVIALRALSHVVFALVGASMLKKQGTLIASPKSAMALGGLLSVIHAVCEVCVVTLFYMMNGMNPSYYAAGYFESVILLVGAGTLVHSMVDFSLALLVYGPVSRFIRIPVSAQPPRLKAVAAK